MLAPCLAAILFLFFFYFSRAHRDLHSFPTRRSSDLSGTCFHRPAPRSLLSLTCCRSFISCGRCFTARVRRDRKSTRLNSSHEWISYAVFCLKKKKTSGCHFGLSPWRRRRESSLSVWR